MNTTIATIGWLLLLAPVASAQQYRFEFLGSIALPEVIIDGAKARIHSQGLYVTDRHFLVTGRLENEPRRSLLVRFSRRRKQHVEYLDITPPNAGGETLDHPGGFDVDPQGLFQIPISTSHRKGPTLITGYRINPARPLAEATIESTVRVEDHLGAICCQGQTMIGANWDTKLLYFIRNGKVERTVKQTSVLSRGMPWLAVQDWKAVALGKEDGGRNHVVVGALVKDAEPHAIVQVVDLLADKVHESHRLARRDDVARPVTNEGLAVHDGILYLLPEDIGRGAKILQYQMTTVVK